MASPPLTVRPHGAAPIDPAEVLAAVDVGVVCVAPDLRIVYGNAAWARAVGVDLSSVVGRSLLEIFADGVGTSGEALVRAVLADGVPRGYQSASADPAAGGVLDVRVCRAESGMLVFTVRPVRTASAVHQAPDAAAEHERLRVLTRAMAAEADAETLISTVCRAAVELCDADGGTVAQVDGETATFISAVGHPDEVVGRRFRVAGTLTARALDEYRRTGRLTSSQADAAEARDGALYEWLSDGRAVGPLLLAPLGTNGELLGVLAVSRAAGEPAFTEQSEHRLRVIADHASLALWKARLIDEARAANLTKSNFLAMVSHELRTPLTALTGYAELLADEIPGPLTTNQHEIVERVRAVTHQLTAMIEEILTFSSLEAGRELVRPRIIDPAEVLRAVAAVAEPLATAKGLGFTCTLAPDLPSVVTDPDKMRQVLVNLVGNAVKFTQQGHVRVVVTPDEGGGIQVAVSDTGVGISESNVGRLFQPFIQLDTGLTRRYGGTGLGLYISRRLTELLGGRILLESAPGQGSTFTLVLPPATPERAG